MPNTIAENLQRLQTATTAIGNAITAKGGTVGANDGLEEFASDIATIPSGGGDYNVKTINVQGQPFGLMHNAVEVNIPNGVTSIEDSAFKDCLRLTKITYPETVTSIGSSAFRGCSSLTELTIPNLTKIPNYLIYQCTSLTSFTIPETVTSIGSSAFRGCVGITNFEIPSLVTSIGGDAFRDCTGLQSIKFKSTTPPTIGGVMTFNGVPTTCIIYVPTGTIETYKAAQYYPNPSTYTYVEY